MFMYFSGEIQDELPVGQWQCRGQTIKDPQGDLAACQPSFHQGLSPGKTILPALC